MTQTVMTAGDSVSTGSVVQGGNDGTLAIIVGPNGAKVTALTVATDGTLTLLKPLTVLGLASMVRLNTANGYGSTNTTIRRFTNTVTNQGSDITYADSATLGATFTINTTGVYGISYCDNFTSAVYLGISLNSTQLTIGISSITAADRLCAIATSAADFPGAVGTTVALVAGSVIRAHTSAGTTGTIVGAAQFTITKVA